jgi:hypothetical protein
MIVFNSNVLKFGGFWLGFGSSPTPPTIYRINVPPTVEHGTVSVLPTEGPTGTLVTISTVPDTGYELDTISLTGAELINGNQFYIDDSDVTVNVTYKSTSLLPANTTRFRFSDPTYDPTVDDTRATWYRTWTRVSSSPNVWDLTMTATDWHRRMSEIAEYMTSKWRDANNEITIVDSTFDGQWYYTFQHASSLKAIEQFHGRIARSESTFWDSGITAFPALNMTGCEELWGTFAYCYNLATCPLIDTSSVQGMGSLFKNSGITVIPSFNTHNVTDFADFAAYCYNLTAIPDLDVSSATDIEEMFFVTPNVQSGMLNMYQKLSALGSQITSPTDRVFALCGVDGEGHYASEQARLERAQIPTTWGGDMQ